MNNNVGTERVLDNARDSPHVFVVIKSFLLIILRNKQLIIYNQIVS